MNKHLQPATAVILSMTVTIASPFGGICNAAAQTADTVAVAPAARTADTAAVVPTAARRDTTYNSDGIEMIWVEGGSFIMGCTNEQQKECNDNEKPTRQVTLSGFYIGKYEITQAQWLSLMDSNPSYFPGDSLPVDAINFVDIEEFLQKLNASSGKNYRLPTEAEWEYAARGGHKSKATKFSGAYNVNEVAWYESNSGKRPHPVGTKAPNELGLHDMSGNVYEWCQDWYDDDYTNASKNNPTGPADGTTRVMRGGNWEENAHFDRVSYRADNNPNDRFNSVGFRVVLVFP
jgi:formylglycine-generating enzyme required for sulfatase activity